MRIPVPNQANQPSVQLCDNQSPLTVIVWNVGTVPVWVGESRATLDASVDSITNLPNEGFKLEVIAAGVDSFKLELHNYIGQLYARAQSAPGAVVMVLTYPESLPPC